MGDETGESVGDGGDGVGSRAGEIGAGSSESDDTGESVGDSGESVGEDGESVSEAGDSGEHLDGGEGNGVEWAEEGGDSGALGMRGSPSSMCPWLMRDWA